jgi:hypothetical protein
MGKPIVIVESPFAGDVEANSKYARAAIRDCLLRGEAPFASHALYTQALDDTKPDERALGIEAGFAFRSVASKTVVYTDRGISYGMELGIFDSEQRGIPVVYRSLHSWRRHTEKCEPTADHCVEHCGTAPDPLCHACHWRAYAKVSRHA